MSNVRPTQKFKNTPNFESAPKFYKHTRLIRPTLLSDRLNPRNHAIDVTHAI